MDACIRTGVTSTEPTLPGGLQVRRRAPGLYKRLQQGFYPAPIGARSGADVPAEAGGKSTQIGRKDHRLGLIPRHLRPVFPGIEYLSCMAIAVNEVNASGGRVVTAP
jgi:L-serine deaminase